MSRYTATDARKQFFHLLDAAERGEEVVLERHGVRFKLTLDVSQVDKSHKDEAAFTVEDTALLEGNWTWVSDEHGQLQFSVPDDT